MSGCADTYIALSGGIGGAKLSLGLEHLLGARLTVIANTGDDFEHLGLYVCPDIDTTLYTLGGIVNPDTGWGRRNETWNFMQSIAELGGPTWFNLGDQDLATHVERTRRLRAGETLTSITAHLAARFGVAPRILPMADDPVRTIVESGTDVLSFQEYFVRDQCRPVARAIRHDGASTAQLSREVRNALSDPNLAGIIICPSNPWLSIDPILAVPQMREALWASQAPVVAVSPIVGGRALKGPTAKIMTELGLEPAVETIAKHYRNAIDAIIVDDADAAAATAISVPTSVTNTVMHTLDEKIALAANCVDFCKRLGQRERQAASVSTMAGAHR